MGPPVNQEGIVKVELDVGRCKPEEESVAL